MNTIIDVAALGFETFKYSGEEAIVRCPFHDDHSPSSSINVVTGVFHCFSCGANSSAEHLATQLGGEVIWVPDNRGLRRVDGGEVETDWRSLLLAPVAFGNEYLHDRGVTDKLIAKYGIRENEDGIIFPLKDISGRICGVQVRHYVRKPKYIFHGVRPALFPFENLTAKPKDPLFIVEGVFGVLNAEKFGVNAVATMGASSFAQSIIYLEQARAIHKGKTAIIFDPDDAGVIAAAKLSVHNFRVVVPFTTADELSQLEWFTIEYDFPSNTTRDPQIISHYADDKSAFWKNYRRYSKTAYGRKNR